jgi:uncharacterized protein
MNPTEKTRKMHLRIEQINEEGLAIEFEEQAEIFPILSEMINQGECYFIAPIKTAVRVIRIDDMIEVKGEVNTQARLPCGRCLQEYELPLKSRFDLTYVNRIPGVQEDDEQDEVEISAREMGLIYFEGEQINLQDGIQEQVILAFPIKALCKKDCKGLCAGCGKDLNTGDCGCNHQPSDPRFAALKNLKLKK